LGEHAGGEASSPVLGKTGEDVEADDLTAGKAFDENGEGGAGGHAELERHAGDRDQIGPMSEGCPRVGKSRGGREVALDECGARRGGLDICGVLQIASLTFGHRPEGAAQSDDLVGQRHETTLHGAGAFEQGGKDRCGERVGRRRRRGAWCGSPRRQGVRHSLFFHVGDDEEHRIVARRA
jgi:hypothetical protein